MDNKFRLKDLIIMLTPLILFSFALPAFPQESKYDANKGQAIMQKTEDKSRHKKIDPALTDLEAAFNKGGAEATTKLAKENHLLINEGNKVTVLIIPPDDSPADQIATSILQSYGADVVKRYDKQLVVNMPIDKMRQIADNVEGIFYIQAERDDEWNKAVKEAIKDAKIKKEERERVRIKAGRANIDELLLKLEADYRKGGVEGIKKYAKSARVRIKDGNKVEVYLILKPGISAEQHNLSELKLLGCEVIDTHSDTDTSIAAYVPIEMISKVAEIDAIYEIVLPHYIKPMS